MSPLDRRVIGAEPRAGPAFGPVDPIGAPGGVVDHVEIKVWKDRGEFFHGPLNLAGGIAINPGFRQVTAELPDDSSGPISSAGHRDPSAIAIDAMAVKHRESGATKQGHVQGPSLGQIGVKAHPRKQGFIADPGGKHHGSGNEGELLRAVTKNRAIHQSGPGGQFNPFRAIHSDQMTPIRGGEGFEHGTGVEDGFSDAEHRPGYRAEQGRPISRRHRFRAGPQRGAGAEHSDSGGEGIRPPEPGAGAGHGRSAKIGLAHLRLLMQPSPLPWHVANGPGGGQVLLTEGVLQAAVNDALGGDALAGSQGRAFDRHRPEACSDGGIEDPQAGDSGSDDQHVDGLFLVVWHEGHGTAAGSPGGEVSSPTRDSDFGVRCHRPPFRRHTRIRLVEHGCVLIPGDGIGPEVVAAARRILDAALDGSGSSLIWTERDAGTAALENGHADLLPDATVESIIECGIALKGPCTTPIGGGFSSVNVALRKRLDLYGAVRPVRNLEGVDTRYRDVDLVVVRENTEGLYAGIENEITEGVVTSLKVATERACLRIARFAFQYARNRGIETVTALHKANIMKLSDGLFIRCARDVKEAEFPDIGYEELIIDAACMRLVQNPDRFGLLLCENLYGDVVSDLCAGFVGGLGVTPGANFGVENAVFEAVHGSAPDIAGQGVANPLAITMSGVMMLNHLAVTRKDAAMGDAAKRIKAAYDAALREGDRTGDLGGSLGTEGFADAVIRRL